MSLFRKVLVANRGEIAVRILRSLREMGIVSVAVYSDADKASPHVALADEAYRLGPARAADSYLSPDRVLAVARQAGCDALIPGYGFLSENAAFARRCQQEGVTFVGPSPEAIEVMGLKPQARAQMQSAGVPVVPGGPAATLAEARITAAQVGYPLMLKAAAGGGGRGMRHVSQPSELASSFERAQSEAQSSFGDGTVYIEKVVTQARHVEVQVLGDTHGGLVHLFERDCSIQRRHQKVVEECPSPRLHEATRQALCDTAVLGARAVNYHSAGTFEFLVDDQNQFYFLELNTRLQVEHPVTELTTGIDLVREMIRVAAGEPLGYDQTAVERRGCAIECRIYAEDPDRNFMPSPGTVKRLRVPEGPGVRHDSGVCEGFVMGFDYDAMLAKLCVWAPDRALAVQRMRRALCEYEVSGLTTNLSFLRRLVGGGEFEGGRYDTGFIEAHRDVLLGRPSGGDPAPADEAMAAALLVAVLNRQQLAGGEQQGSGKAAQSSEWSLPILDGDSITWSTSHPLYQL
jgi:acetyl-CoA carboxylase biotin carboxylase subunit